MTQSLADINWLARMCLDRDYVRSLQPPTQLDQPLTVTIGGTDYAMATNGRVMLFIHGDHGYQRATESDTARINKALSTRPRGKTEVAIDLATLKRFLHAEPIPSVCPTCNDKARIPCPEGSRQWHEENDCDVCAEDQTLACPLCVGSTWPIDQVRIGIGLFNRRLIAPWIARLEGRCTWAQEDPHKMALLRGDGWRLCIMPLNPEKVEHVPNVQTFPIPEPAGAA